MDYINSKVISVITSCNTSEQLDCAKRYLKLARKSNGITRDAYHVGIGVISALKGVFDSRIKGDKNEDDL